MEPYANVSGNSGVTFYELGSDFVRVWFADAAYVYDYRSAGAANVERMKRLARQGRGLSTFISTAVRNRYASKESLSASPG